MQKSASDTTLKCSDDGFTIPRNKLRAGRYEKEGRLVRILNWITVEPIAHP